MSYQKFPDSKQLYRELNADKLEKIYLFLGEEEGEKEKIIQRIIDKAIPDKEKKNYSTARFHMEYDELHAAVEFALSGSMFSNVKVCIILNINSLKSKGDDTKLFAELLENTHSNILIMTSEENKVPPIIDTKYLNKIKIIQFWRLFESDITSYIIKSLKINGIEIHREAINLLIDFTGRDIKKIDEALFKIINSGEKSINHDLIMYLIPDEKQVSVFEFIDSLFQKNKNIFQNLAKVIDAGNHELAILKLIMRQAELIEKYYYLIDNETSSEQALQEIGIGQKNKKSFLNCAGNFSLESIKRVFPLIYRADYRLKSYNYSGDLSSNPLFDLAADMLMER